jgi:protein required for attachment to host cells
MKPHWILIANASQARLVQQEEGCPFVMLKAFQHPASRQRSSILGDDKAGREQSDRAFGGAAYEPRMDAQHKEFKHFADELARELETAAQADTFSSLSIFASSPFLGILKQELGDGTRRLLKDTRHVDLTSVGLTELEKRVQFEQAQARAH